MISEAFMCRDTPLECPRTPEDGCPYGLQPRSNLLRGHLISRSASDSFLARGSLLVSISSSISCYIVVGAIHESPALFSYNNFRFTQIFCDYSSSFLTGLLKKEGVSGEKPLLGLGSAKAEGRGAASPLRSGMRVLA